MSVKIHKILIFFSIFCFFISILKMETQERRISELEKNVTRLRQKAKHYKQLCKQHEETNASLQKLLVEREPTTLEAPPSSSSSLSPSPPSPTTAKRPSMRQRFLSWGTKDKDKTKNRLSNNIDVNRNSTFLTADSQLSQSSSGNRLSNTSTNSLNKSAAEEFDYKVEVGSMVVNTLVGRSKDNIADNGEKVENKGPQVLNSNFSHDIVIKVEAID